MTNHKLLNFTLSAILLTLFFLLLYFGHSLLVPFVVAVVIWYLIVNFVDALENIPYIGRYIPKWIAFILAIVVAFAVIYFIFNLVSNNITELINIAPSYQERFLKVKDQLFAFFNIKTQPDFSQVFENFNMISLLSSAAGIMADFGRNLFIILIYVLFLLLEHNSFDQKLSFLIRDPQKLASARNMLNKITVQIQSYLKIKALMGMITAGCSYIILLVVGVDFADFWALLIFIFNFIPNIGSILATILPCLLTLIQFDSFTPFFIVTLSLSAVQFTIGNFLEPRLMGKSFNLSPLVIILGLAVWGYLWGIVGMLLCVPIMVIVNIIFANFPGTKPISILMSATGDIED
ncbi:MAG: AI-2 transport protein TqsA [Chlamydiae bacterium]|nr:AI-2 transport protein TqsA [Chlamydiota bacterium]